MTDYDYICKQLESLSEGVKWDITVLSNAAALLWDSFEYINWAGFYIMKNGKGSIYKCRSCCQEWDEKEAQAQESQEQEKAERQVPREERIRKQR